MKYVTTIEQMAKEEGKKEGKTEGKKEGKKEERNAIALNMLRKNMLPETIAEVTGMTIAQLQELQAKAE